MRWLDRLLRPRVDEELEEGDRAIVKLRGDFKAVHIHTKRLEQELLRVNEEMRRQQATAVR